MTAERYTSPLCEASRFEKCYAKGKVWQPRFFRSKHRSCSLQAGQPSAVCQFHRRAELSSILARPPAPVKDLVAGVQQQLVAIAPSKYPGQARNQMLIARDLWLMPVECLHMTALEITFSLTALEIDNIIDKMHSKIPEITDCTFSHRARLIKPMLSYDTSAIALSLAPAAGESLPEGRPPTADAYTYHHLRRDLYDLSRSTGVEVASRYVVPSAHLTIARFVTQADISKGRDDDTPDQAKVQKLLEHIETINEDLSERYWPKEGQEIPDGGQWLVGQGKGLDCRKGTLWYGGGETVRLGKGF